jgi:anaerobic selenocysteine-containing dehydrogenase
MAFPGIRSTNTVGLGELSGALVEESVTATASPATASLSDVSAGRRVEVPPYDNYALVLDVSHRLYDHGVAVQGSPALKNLVARSTVYLNHFDLDRMGLVTGDVVDVTALKGTISLPVTLSDDTPRGTLGIVFGSLDAQGDDGASRFLFDPASAFTHVRLESR